MVYRIPHSDNSSASQAFVWAVIMTAYSGLPPFTQDWVRLIGLPTYAASGFYIYIYTIVDLGHRSDHEDTIYIYIFKLAYPGLYQVQTFPTRKCDESANEHPA